MRLCMFNDVLVVPEFVCIRMKKVVNWFLFSPILDGFKGRRIDGDNLELQKMTVSGANVYKSEQFRFLLELTLFIPLYVVLCIYYYAYTTIVYYTYIYIYIYVYIYIYNIYI